MACPNRDPNLANLSRNLNVCLKIAKHPQDWCFQTWYLRYELRARTKCLGMGNCHTPLTNQWERAHNVYAWGAVLDLTFVHLQGFKASVRANTISRVLTENDIALIQWDRRDGSKCLLRRFDGRRGPQKSMDQTFPLVDVVVSVVGEGLYRTLLRCVRHWLQYHKELLSHRQICRHRWSQYRKPRAIRKLEPKRVLWGKLSRATNFTIGSIPSFHL